MSASYHGTAHETDRSEYLRSEDLQYQIQPISFHAGCNHWMRSMIIRSIRSSTLLFTLIQSHHTLPPVNGVRKLLKTGS